MATPAALQKLLDQWRDFALTFPGAEVGSRPWGATVVKAGKKTFVSMGIDGDAAAICCKLTDSRDASLTLPFVDPNHIGGESGWTVARFDRPSSAPRKLIEEWIAESYRTLAPKKLSKAATPATAAPKKKPTSKPRPKAAR